LKLQRRSAEMLAMTYLLAEEAKERGFTATDAELAAFLKDEERNLDFRIYSDEGRFDAETYQNFIQFGLRMTLEDYQEFKRRELIVSKYMAVLESSVVVSDKEVDALNQLRSLKVELEFVALDPKALEESLAFDEAAVEAYVSSHGDAIQRYYDEHAKEFGTPMQVRRRRIMVRKPQADASEADKSAAEAKWARVKKRVLEDKEDFEKVVSEESEDVVYASKGGDMGWSELEFMDKAEAELMKAMKPGEVREHASDVAWLVLRLEEVKEANVTPLEQVRSVIARKLMVQEQGSAEVRKMADALLKAAQAAPSKPLEEVLSGLKPAPPAEGAEAPASPWSGLQVQTTGKFAREPRRSFKFDPEKKSIVPTSGAWTEVPRIGDNKALAVAAFGLTAEKPVVEQVVEQEGRLYVARLKERAEPTAEELEKSRVAVEAELRRQVLNDTLGAWQVIFIRPDLELSEISPWMAQRLEKAKESGQLRIPPDAFVVPGSAPAASAPAASAGSAAPGASAPGASGAAPAAAPAGSAPAGSAPAT
jgi:parvulin-like peptidyl-prolyl isomerase